MNRTPCPVCDFPLATEADSAEAAAAGLTLRDVLTERRLCWIIHGCHVGPAIDWRARALKAEARPDATQALRVAMEALDAALTSTRCRNVECDHSWHRQGRAAFDLIRAHVKPTPLEAALREVTR